MSRQRARADGIHHPEVLLERLLVGDVLVASGGEVEPGIGRVDTIDLVLGHQEHIGVEFQGAQGGGGVGGEVGVAGTGGEDDDPALFHVANGPAPDVRLGDFVHGDGGHDPGVDALVFEGVLEGEGVETVATMPM